MCKKSKATKDAVDMHKGGFIIRLIDVTLIILFGFLKISTIQSPDQLRLPSQAEQEEVERTLHIITVQILEQEEYTIKDKAEGRLKVIKKYKAFDLLKKDLLKLKGA